MGVFEAGEGQTKVIEPAIQQLAGNGDAEIGDLGEVRQAHAARRMLLADDHLPIRAVHRPPRPNPPLKRAPRPGAQFRVPTAKFIENCDRPQSGGGLQHRQNFVLPDLDEWIGSTAFAMRLLLGGKSGVLFEPVGGGGAESGLRSGNGWRMVAAQVHEKPHLLIGDMPAGQRIGPLEGEADPLPAAVTAK